VDVRKAEGKREREKGEDRRLDMVVVVY